MYVSPVLSKNTSQTPKEYTNRARDEISKKLNLKASAPQLRHGSSPLKYVANASDSSPSLSKSNSSESLELPMALNQESQMSKEKSKSKLFGLSRLKSLSSNNSSSSLRTVTKAEDQDQAQDNDQDVDMDGYEEHLALHPVPSISSSFSSQSSGSTISSAPSITTNADSIFTNNTIQTQITNVSQYSGDSTIIPQSQQSYQQQSIPEESINSLTLHDALPHSFHDMYAPELLADPSLLIDGRPMFTKRALLDWELNDIRSLLIVEQLRPEWNGRLPEIKVPSGFKLQYLPLDADDETVVRVLVESDIYKESKFDLNFRIQTAKYTLNAARQRHAMFLQNSGIPLFYNNRLSKPEWRNVIENYLLNLAVESQCRYDFKKACHEQKKFKRNQSLQSSSSNGGNSLLRKALLNDVNKDSPVKLTKDDKAKLWTQVQSKVYKRIGLDWTPDTL
ncbi:hypothetical protein BN7_6450 [Wickerhamomyces ciferrii]|uniref:Protein MTH1 n=1 Tax=Wickerhamomyces ciferrii (strain ATCC 14091 / BCRC 22168 / CBS 111 / JCM 3599 / NBRC 0793 / NRRL Y-1031 F-60-10) TaxID=1206466 RepID=K0KZT5_WICCF|nr:uncharacterized protein BN7_6450 [Wickerhamomyces ciferrii]CCH46849.1 hypothetical protein BN7_6450 [Wickerhamomyces ciferrii]